MASVRSARSEDRASLRRLFRETLSYYEMDAPPPPASSIDRAIDRLIGPGDPSCLLAFREEAAVGYLVYAVLFPPVAGACFVKELFVSSAARDRGVGPALLAEAARRSIDEGWARIDVTTDAANHGAVRFYRRLDGDQIASKRYFRFESDALRRLAER